jgi:dihydrolipoamide dehydrogenase
MLARKDKVVGELTKGIEFLFKKNKITWLKGTGVLGANKSVKVTAADGTMETHTATKGVVIATGSRVKGLPQIGLELDKTLVLSSDEALTLDAAPATLAVIGAGAVGCEFADVFNAFGSKVTILEVMPRILPVEDEDCSVELAKSFKKRGIEVITGAKLGTITKGKANVTIPVEVNGEKKALTFDKVLVAAGRAPNIESIGLKEAGVQTTERGFIKITERFETSVKGIYAIGDVAGPPMLAHKGSREGHVVADILAGHAHHPVNYGNIPNATYCHPEVASIGLTEGQCKEKGLKYKVGKFPFSANGRARTSGETEGFVKVIRDEKHGEILGAHIIGAHATEMIHEFAVARENEYTVEEIDLAIHAHPTLSEAIAEAVLDSMGKMLHA